MDKVVSVGLKEPAESYVSPRKADFYVDLTIAIF